MADVRIAPKPGIAIQPALQPSSAEKPRHSILSAPVILPPRRANRRRRQELAVLKTALAMSKPTITIQPSSNLMLHNLEGHYFELFRVHTATQLSGYFNSNFWTQRVLQECHSEAAIRHAVVALGALYKTLEQSAEVNSPSGSGSSVSVVPYDSVMGHWQVAIKQYSEACNAIMSIKGENLDCHRTRLMAIILLACFDSFIGDHKQGIIQIQTGLGILEQYQSGRALSPTNDGYIEEDLVLLFTRLAIQAKSYDMAFHFPHPYVIHLSSPNTRPSTSDSARSSPSEGSSPPASRPFDTLVEARVASDKLCEALLLFIEKLQRAKSDPSYLLPPSWKKYSMGLKDRLRGWSDAFDPIFQTRTSPNISHLERSGICALKMFQINTNILFLMIFCDNEVQFDAFMPHFKAIVDLGWEIVGEDERLATAEKCSNPETCKRQHNITKGGFRAGKYPMSHIQPSFSADLGIVPPLFVVATKCRDPKLRRQAIQLLRSSARREGMWDSELAANIGEWVMQVEEYDERSPLGFQGTPGVEHLFADAEGITQRTIPEERRVMIKSVDFDLRARYADLQVGTRAIQNGLQDVRFRQTRITW